MSIQLYARMGGVALAVYAATPVFLLIILYQWVQEVKVRGWTWSSGASRSGGGSSPCPCWCGGSVPAVHLRCPIGLGPR